MRKVRLGNNMKIMGIRNFRGAAKKIDYYANSGETERPFRTNGAPIPF